jgi:hypothetical protein
MRKTILGSLKRRGLSVALLVAVGVLGFWTVAAADTVGSIDFESAQSYVAGNIDGQKGWSKLGADDVEVEKTDRFGFGQALRISNAVTTGAFGDQAFSPGLTEPAGESARKHFEASFNIATKSNGVHEGLAISTAPETGASTRATQWSACRAPDAQSVSSNPGLGAVVTAATLNTVWLQGGSTVWANVRARRRTRPACPVRRRERGSARARSSRGDLRRRRRRPWPAEPDAHRGDRIRDRPVAGWASDRLPPQ